MRISRKSRLVRWGYWGNPPSQTTLCKFFWRVFVWNAVVIVGLSMLAAVTCVCAWTNPVQFFGTLAVVIVTIGAVALGAYLDDKAKMRRLHRDYERRENPTPDGLFIASLKAAKGKVCPIIQIE